MANRLTKLQTAVYVAAVTPIPARPAFCVTDRLLVGYARRSGNGGFGSGGVGGGSGNAGNPPDMVYAPPDPVNNPSYGEALSGGSWVTIPSLGPSSGGGVSGGSSLAPRYQTTTTCYPAYPGREAVAARVDYLANVGWNAGARSRARVPTFGEFSGTLPATIVATQFGLARRSYDHVYSSMTHSIVARQGEWSIVESGITKATGPLPARARLSVRREGSAVTYHVNGDLIHRSDVPLAGDMYGAALLYTLGDSVDNPAIVSLSQVNQFSGDAPRWAFLASDRHLAYVDVAWPRPIFAARLSRLEGVDQFYGVAPRPVGVASDRQLAFVSGRAPAFVLAATLSRMERVPDQMVAMAPRLAVSMNLRSGGMLTVQGRIPRVLGLAADRQLAYVKAVMPVRAYLTAIEPYMPTGEFDGMDTAIAADFNAIDAALLLVTLDSVGLSSSADITVVMELSTMDSVRLSAASSFGQLIEMLAMDRVAVSSSPSNARHQAIQYAVNALTGAPTRYEGFDFSSFATVAGVTYGIRADGLYRIGEATDNGELITALIDFGTTDFADSHLKRAELAYIGLRTDGECYLRVQGDAGLEKVYRLSGEGTVRRSMLAKGVAARNWSVQLEVVDASYAEVDSFELLVAASQRRGSGYRTR